MSLSVLLDYRTEDNKENTFEVSLFAELFNEMLMRDSGFRLYKSVLQAADSKSSTTTTSDTDKHSKVSFYILYFIKDLAATELASLHCVEIYRFDNK